MVNVGSRDESADRFGLAHFVEHTIFKGTRHRRSWHISNRMEAVGGELNAYTTKEETVLYTVAPRYNLPRSIELLGDLITDSLFPAAELDKERDVVADEINSYLDSPPDAVYDDFEDLIFAGSQLGHNILGTVDSISNFTSDVCREYIETFYTPGEMVFFYSGAERADRVFARVEKSQLGQLNRRDTGRQRVMPRQVSRFDISKTIDSHQSHTIVGARVPGRLSDKRFAISLLTNILGGPGMNSLLNMKLRERLGLVYTIDASTALYTDCGILTIYFGCDAGDLTRCQAEIADTLEAQATVLMSPRRLEQARKQYLGQMIVAGENREQSVLGAARSILHRGYAVEPAAIIDSIKALTADDILEAAGLLRPENCSVLTLS